MIRSFFKTTDFIYWNKRHIFSILLFVLRFFRRKIIIGLFTVLLITSTHATELEKCAGIEYAADTLMTFHQMGSDVEKAKEFMLNYLNKKVKYLTE